MYDALLLAIDDNPFMSDSDAKVYTDKDLQSAVLICSTPSERLLEGRAPHGKLQTALWGARSIGLNFVDECAKFTHYIKDYLSAPKYWQEDGEGENASLKAPWLLANAAYLLRNAPTLTCTVDGVHYAGEDAIWRMPIGKVLWYCATIAEQRGESKWDLISEEESEALKAMGLTV